MVSSVTIPCKGTITVPLFTPSWSASVGYNTSGFWKQSLLPIITQGSSAYGGNNSSGSSMPTTYGLSAWLLEYLSSGPNNRSLQWGTVGPYTSVMWRPFIVDGSSAFLALGGYLGTTYTIPGGSVLPMEWSQVKFSKTLSILSQQIKTIRSAESFSISGGNPLSVTQGSIFDTTSTFRPICVGSVGAGNQVPVSQFYMVDIMSTSGSSTVTQPGGRLFNRQNGSAAITLFPNVDGDTSQYTQPTTFMSCPDTRASSPMGSGYTQGMFFVCAADTHSARPFIGSVAGSIVNAGPSAASNYPYPFTWPVNNYIDQAYQFGYGGYGAPSFLDGTLDALWAGLTSANSTLNPSYQGLCCRLWPASGSPRDILLWFKLGSYGPETWYYNVQWSPQDSDATNLINSNLQALDWKFDNLGVAYVYANASKSVATSIGNALATPAVAGPPSATNLFPVRLPCWQTMCLPIARGTR
jgi:hypothetical protein